MPPNWKAIGGFDVGKANPTAALVGAIDFEGCIYILREYYQPGLTPKQHVPALEQLKGFSTRKEIAPILDFLPHPSPDRRNV